MHEVEHIQHGLCVDSEKVSAVMWRDIMEVRSFDSVHYFYLKEYPPDSTSWVRQRVANLLQEDTRVPLNLYNCLCRHFTVQELDIKAKNRFKLQVKLQARTENQLELRVKQQARTENQLEFRVKLQARTENRLKSRFSFCHGRGNSDLTQNKPLRQRLTRGSSKTLGTEPFLITK